MSEPLNAAELDEWRVMWEGTDPEMECSPERLLATIDALQSENARLRAQAEALAAVVEIARNGWHWCNAADHRADGMAHLQSRVKDLADKADAVLRAFREAPNDAG